VRPPFQSRTSRASIAGWIAALAAVVVGFAWVAVKSYDIFHTEPLGTSNLEPVAITGPEQTVFDWKRDACEPRDVPDTPARAFRDSDGTVHLLASHYVTRQETGSSLDRVRHRCGVVMRPHYDPDPSHFQDKEWLSATYALNGKTVFGLIHDEYQGNTHAGHCISNEYLRCWYNAITLARSDDAGATFKQAPPAPSNLVAEVPYRYKPDTGRYGIFQPSNIVHRGDYYYALVSTTTHGKQQGGTCVMRTKRLDDPKAWRAWGGSDYDVSFVDPYRDKFNPNDHLCTPVSVDQISDMTSSLTYNTYFGKYLLVSPANEYVASKRRVVSGFYYSVSRDLITWSRRKLIREVELLQTYRCGDRDPLFYPSVLDPTSKSPNFETTGRRPYLYFTRLHYKACQLTLDRDLVRVPVEFSK
jgi:hypothetical protein